MKKGDLVWIAEKTEKGIIILKSEKGKIINNGDKYNIYQVKLNNGFLIYYHESELTLRKASFNIRKALKDLEKALVDVEPGHLEKYEKQKAKIIRAFEKGGE